MYLLVIGSNILGRDRIQLLRWFSSCFSGYDLVAFKALDHSAALPVVSKGFIRLECAQTQNLTATANNKTVYF